MGLGFRALLKHGGLAVSVLGFSPTPYLYKESRTTMFANIQASILQSLGPCRNVQISRLTAFMYSVMGAGAQEASKNQDYGLSCRMQWDPSDGFGSGPDVQVQKTALSPTCWHCVFLVTVTPWGNMALTISAWPCDNPKERIQLGSDHALWEVQWVQRFAFNALPYTLIPKP